MDEVVRHLGARTFGRDKTRPLRTDVDALQLLRGLDGDAQVLPAREHVVIHHLDAKHIAQRRVKRDFGLAQGARLRQAVAQHEGHLEGRTRALEGRGGQRQHRIAALALKRVHAGPSGLRSFGAGVDAGQALLANCVHIHALDQRPVLVRAHGHDQVVVLDALARRRDHRVAGRVQLADHVLDPVELRRMEVCIAVAHLAHRPHARGHQGVTGLVVVLFLAVDQGDLGPVEQGMEPVGHGNAAEASAQNHDVRLRFGFGRLGSGRSAGQNGGACRAQQPLAPAQRGG